MTDSIEHLFERNKQWATQLKQEDPRFFERLAKEQKPKYLWIGCADSRIPASQVLKLMPGEVFEHRNIANIVLQTDLNCMSVLDFAVQTLRVRHIIVCGHYGCAGVRAAMGNNQTTGVLGSWLSNIRTLWREHQNTLETLDSESAHARLCELNVHQQVKSVCQTSTLQQAWRDGQAVEVHGWIYNIKDGLLHKLGKSIMSNTDLEV